MSIIISQNGKNAQKVDKSDFEKEGYLQNYIHENPESIPVYEIEEDKKLFVVAREFSTESGPIDALAIDKDGDIYVVETKLYKNPDKRDVVAQALDYGASLWRHSDYGEFMSEINEEVVNKFKIGLEEKMLSFFDIDNEQVRLALEAMRRNLQQGNIKFVILMDTIDDRLKDLIVYINQNSQFDIYAVQMEYYKFEKYEIMIPKLFGVEVKKSISSSSSSERRKWTVDDFLPATRKEIDDERFKAVEKIFRFCEQYADEITMGTGTGSASINPIFSKLCPEKSILVLKSNGKLGFKLSWAKERANNAQKQKLDELANKLREINFPVPNDNSSVNMGFDGWAPKVDKIIEVLSKIILS